MEHRGWLALLSGILLEEVPSQLSRYRHMRLKE